MPSSQGKTNPRGRVRPRASGREGDPDNEHLYTPVDRFHLNRDKIHVGEDSSDEKGGEADEQEEAVMDLEVPGSSDDEDDEDSEDDSEDDMLSELPEHLRRAAMKATDGEGEGSSEEDDDRGRRGWGSGKRAYYNADTADLEIGQEFEDAEDEEKEARRLQRDSYVRLLDADFDDGDDEESDEDGAGRAGQAIEQRLKKDTGKGAGARHTPELSMMQADLEHIFLGGSTEVVASEVRRDMSRLSRADRLQRVLSESPELPSLLAELRAHLGTLSGTVGPLAASLTAELGASEEGLLYLRSRQQLLLGFCLNVCFYLLLKAKGLPVKDHPVIGQLLAYRRLIDKMAPLDKKMAPQLELAMAAITDLTASSTAAAVADGGGGSGEEEEEEEEGDGAEEGDSGSGDEQEEATAAAAGGLDEDRLDAEEARFMAGVWPAAGSNQSGAKKGKAKKGKGGRSGGEAQRQDGRLPSSAADPVLQDFGDEAVPGAGGAMGKGKGRGKPGAGGGGGGGEGAANRLEAMVNRITQRERSSAAAAAGPGRMQGDEDVPVLVDGGRAARPRRPAPEEGEEEAEEQGWGGGGGGGGSGGSDSDEGDDDGMDFFGGLPPGLLGGGGRGQGKGKGSKGEGRKRKSGEGEGGAEEDDEEDDFYTAVAQEKARRKQGKRDKYTPALRVAGALEVELEEEMQRAARLKKGKKKGKGGAADEAAPAVKRGASDAMVKNRGLTPHKGKLNRNPRAKKREKYRKAEVARGGQVRRVRSPGEGEAYGGEATGIRSRVTHSRKLTG